MRKVSVGKGVLVLQDHKVIEVSLGCKDCLVLLERLVYLEIVVSQAVLVYQETLDHSVRRVTEVHLGLLAYWA